MKTSGLAKWGEGVSSKFRLFLDALKRFNEDHCFLLSSGIAFALLLCLIPLLLLVLALIGTYLFSDQEVLNHISEYLKDMFPSLDPRITEKHLGNRAGSADCRHIGHWWITLDLHLGF